MFKTTSHFRLMIELLKARIRRPPLVLWHCPAQLVAQRVAYIKRGDSQVIGDPPRRLILTTYSKKPLNSERAFDRWIDVSSMLRSSKIATDNLVFIWERPK